MVQRGGAGSGASRFNATQMTLRHPGDQGQFHLTQARLFAQLPQLGACLFAG